MSTDPRHELGRRGEQLAAEHLERLGYEVSPATTAPASASSTWSSPTPRRSCSARSRPVVRAPARRGTRSARQAEPGPEHGRGVAVRGPRPAPDLGAPLRRRRRRPRPAAPSSLDLEGVRACALGRHSLDVSLWRREPRADHRVRARRRRLAAGVGRGRHPHRPAGVHDRRARRQGGPRGARARARGDHELGLRVPAEAHHDQPRPGVSAQGRPGLRPAARGGDPRRQRPGGAPRRSRTAPRGRAVADRRAAADARRARGRPGRGRARARAG